MLGFPVLSSLPRIDSIQSEFVELSPGPRFLVGKPGVLDWRSSKILLQSQSCVITGLPSSLPPCKDAEYVIFLLAAQRAHLSSNGLNAVYDCWQFNWLQCRVGSFSKALPGDTWSPVSRVQGESYGGAERVSTYLPACHADSEASPAGRRVSWLPILVRSPMCVCDVW